MKEIFAGIEVTYRMDGENGSPILTPVNPDDLDSLICAVSESNAAFGTYIEVE